MLLLRLELMKLSRRLTPYVVYALIIGLVAIIVISFRLSDHKLPRLDRAETGGLDTLGDPKNAVLICQFCLETIARFLPFLAPIVAGEILGGEAATGTLRTLLVRPRSRLALWTAKFATALLYTFSLCGFLMVFSYVLGALTFGRGPLWEWNAMMSGRVLILTEGEALLFLGVAYAILAIAVFVTAALAFALGSFFDSGLVPGFLALGLVVAMQIVGALDFEWVDRLRPYLFTTYLQQYTRAFPTSFDPVTQALHFPGNAVWEVIGPCLAYVAAFGGIGLWRFMRRDITC